MTDLKGELPQGPPGDLPSLEDLKNEVVSLLQEKESLTSHICPSISLAYTVRVGHLRCELFELELQASKVKRMTELIQRSINLSQKFSLPEAEETVQKELETRFMNLDFMKVALKKDLEAVKEAGPQVPHEELSALKALYRLIAKKLHPDLNPNLSDKEKALFGMATEAYKELNLETLAEISAVLDQSPIVSGDGLPAPSREDTEREISRLKGILKNLKEKIASIKDSYPYSKLPVLNDPTLLEEEREGFLKRIEQEKARLLFYQEKLKNMTEGGHGGQIH
jgi:hypothetical protein